MTQEPQEQNKPTQLPAPDIMSSIAEMDVDPELVQYSAYFAALTATQRTILTALTLNILSENTLTDRDLAIEIGVGRNTIMNARKNPKFATALAAMMRSIVAGKADVIINNLFRIAKNETKANEVLSRIAEFYTPTSRNLNVNAQINTQLDAPQSPQQAIEAVTTSSACYGSLVRLMIG
jgi:hypothetical protein